jgi:hypothetical protein
MGKKETRRGKVAGGRGPVKRAAGATAAGTKKVARLVGAAIVSGIIYDAAKSTASRAVQPKKGNRLRRTLRASRK